MEGARLIVVFEIGREKLGDCIEGSVSERASEMWRRERILLQWKEDLWR